MYKKIMLLLVICTVIFCACGRADTSSEQVLTALIDAEIGLPAGQLYLSSSPEDDAAYLSADLMAALYGEGELPWQLSLIEDYGIYLSTAQHPCEFAVFRCYARSDTDEIAALCHVRLCALRNHYKNTQYTAYLQNASVVVIGKYVLLLISSDTEHALRTAKGVI